MTTEEFKAWLATSSSRRVVLFDVGVIVEGVPGTLYMADRPFITSATDTPASTAYEPCIMGGAGNAGNLSLDGDASISNGDIEIGNPGGIHDYLLDYVFDNQRVEIYLGDASWANKSDFTKVFDGVVGPLLSSDPELLNLPVLDMLQRLNNPITESVLGGATANKEKLQPLTFGECFNVSPRQRDPATLEYDFHDGQSERLIEVRSNGYAPVANTPDLMTGRFVLGDSPGNTNITASVQGDAPGGVYSNDIAGIVERIVTGYGPVDTRLDAGDIDAANFADFAAAHPDVVGLHCRERTNVLAACQQLAGSVGAYVVPTALAKLRLVQLALPAAGVPIDITAADFEDGSLQIESRPKVQAACVLGYVKNYTPQEALAADLNPASVALYREEWLTVTSEDAGVAADYKLSLRPPMQETLLQDESEAQAECDRRLALWSAQRTVFRMRCFAHMLLTELGDAVTLTHVRFGLEAGRTGIVIGIDRDWLAGRITLQVLV